MRHGKIRPKVKATCFHNICRSYRIIDNGVRKLSKNALKHTEKSLLEYDAHIKYRSRSEGGHKKLLCESHMKIVRHILYG